MAFFAIGISCFSGTFLAEISRYLSVESVCLAEISRYLSVESVCLAEVFLLSVS